MRDQGLEIRSARPGDLADLIELYRHLNPTDDPIPDGPKRQAVWEAMLGRPGFTCIVGINAGTLAASCCLVVVPNLTRAGRPYAFIENVVTHADYRCRGFGKAIVSHALDEAWRAGCYKTMLLSGSKRPEVHRFYASCGFRSDDKTGFVARPA